MSPSKFPYPLFFDRYLSYPGLQIPTRSDYKPPFRQGALILMENTLAVIHKVILETGNQVPFDSFEEMRANVC